MADINDITGIGKIIDSKVAEKAYGDMVAPGAKQVGSTLEDTLKALRLFTAPVQLMAAYQDRLSGWLDEVRSRVPEERQVEAPANVAGPVLLGLRFEDDESILKEMFLNLLTAAIDKDRQGDAHPGFAKIIEQMSPDEARFLQRLIRVLPFQQAQTALSPKPAKVGAIADGIIPSDVPAMRRIQIICGLHVKLGLEGDVSDYSMHIDRYEALGLIAISTFGTPLLGQAGIISMTRFGTMFARTCIPGSLDR